MSTTAVPRHCGIDMAISTVQMRCQVCGYEMKDTIVFEPETAPKQAPAPALGLAQGEGDEALVGKTLGKCQVTAVLGRGGMATVYKAYQPGLERHVAIKVLLRFPAHEQGFLARFRQEARIVAGLHHPNILTVYDFGEEEGLTYIVMEYVEGGTLKQRMGKPMPIDQVAQIVSQVGSALEYAHGRGIVHRDVKPSNILVTGEGRVVLSDFGIARMLESSEKLTQTGMGIGTPEYMAPEQGQGLAIDFRVDVYSLGVVFYELVTGKVPFSGDTPYSALLKHMTAPPPPPRALNPAIPPAVEGVILRALAKDPQQRFQSAGEMVAALEASDGGRFNQVAAGEAPTIALGQRAAPTGPHQLPLLRLFRRRTAPAVLFVILLLAFAAAALLTMLGRLQ